MLAPRRVEHKTMFKPHNRALAALALLTLAMLPGIAGAQANPAIPFYGYGAIVANPSFPIVGENAVITVTVSNTGSSAASNVQLKLSFNDWGVTFMGWQEIGTQTIASIPAGGTATATFNYVFQNRTHTCLEALIVGADENTDPNDDRGQINLEVIHAGETFSYGVPVVNNGDQPRDVLVQVHLLGERPDGGVGGGEPIPLHLEPGEAAIIPIELDLRGFGDGSVRQVLVDAFDPADPTNTQTREHVLLRVVKTSARLEKLFWFNDLKGLEHSIPDRRTAHRFHEALEHLEDALEPKLWRDNNHLVGNKGQKVFVEEGFFDRAASRLLPQLPPAIRTRVAEALNALVDCDRILADTARGEATSRVLPAVQRLMDAADAARLAGDYPEAIHLYQKAWQKATQHAD
jgi:hypothetical protein